jgi:hypothetical protein
MLPQYGQCVVPSPLILIFSVFLVSPDILSCLPECGIQDLWHITIRKKVRAIIDFQVSSIVRMQSNAPNKNLCLGSPQVTGRNSQIDVM